MVCDHRGGGEGHPKPILIQTSFYSVDLAIFSANLKNSEYKDHS